MPPNWPIRQQIEQIQQHERCGGEMPTAPGGELQLIYAAGVAADNSLFPASHSVNWDSAKLSYAAMACLTSVQNPQDKDFAGISLCALMAGATARGIENVVSWTGIAFDDDNHKNLGRAKIITTVGPFRICYGTASDGKTKESIPLSALRDCGLAKASDEDIQRTLNRHKDGEPCRGVKGVRTVNGLLKVRQKGEDYFIDITMDPHERTRSLVGYKYPITGPLFVELRERRLFPSVSREIQLDIYGTSGHDEKTFMPNSVAFLPVKNHTEFFHTTCGGQELYDPIPIAERVLAEASRPKQKVYAPRPAQRPRKGRLYRLLLATLIVERFPELRHGNKDSPVVLRRCPFADEHGSKRGQADGSAYVYDADPEGSGYPYIGCQHDSCKGRKTQEFIARMIEDGDLTEEALQDPDYRIELE